MQTYNSTGFLSFARPGAGESPAARAKARLSLRHPRFGCVIVDTLLL